MLIALHGHVRCGKDTAADYLVEHHGFFNTSFGEGIYEEVAPAFGVTIEQLQSDYWKKNDVDELALIHCTDDDFIATALLHDDNPGPTYIAQMEKPRSSRFILQRWATEYRRADDLMYWVEQAEERIYNALACTHYNGNVVISDLREMHEYTMLQSLAVQFNVPFRVLEIVRAGTVKTNHSSDAGLPERFINTRIENDDLDVYLSAISRTVKNIQRTV